MEASASYRLGFGRIARGDEINGGVLEADLP
jgi:hypothetical protein